MGHEETFAAVQVNSRNEVFYGWSAFEPNYAQYGLSLEKWETRTVQVELGRTDMLRCCNSNELLSTLINKKSSAYTSI